MKTITVKYNGNKTPLFGGVPVLPGINEIDADQFNAHIATPIGQIQLKTKEFEIIQAEKPVDGGESDDVNFLNFPVAKQKELVLESFNINWLEELKDLKKINATVRTMIIDRIAELTAAPEGEKVSEKVED